MPPRRRKLLEDDIFETSRSCSKKKESKPRNSTNLIDRRRLHASVEVSNSDLMVDANLTLTRQGKLVRSIAQCTEFYKLLKIPFVNMKRPIHLRIPLNTMIVKNDNLNYGIIDCSCLLEPEHIYSYLYMHMTHIEPKTALKIPADLISAVSDGGKATNWIVLLNCDDLLRDDPVTLGSVIRILSSECSKFNLVLVSCLSSSEYDLVMGMSRPHLMYLEDIVSDASTLVDCASRVLAFDNQKNMKDLARIIYDLSKDFVSSPRVFIAILKRFLVVGRTLSRKYVNSINFSLTITLDLSSSQMYSETAKFIASLIGGSIFIESLHLSCRSLSLIEKYLVIAAFIACNNPLSTDLKIFGTLKISKRRSVRSSGSKGTKLIECLIPESIAIGGGLRQSRADRILAIFYFIYGHSDPRNHSIDNLRQAPYLEDVVPVLYNHLPTKNLVSQIVPVLSSPHQNRTTARKRLLMSGTRFRVLFDHDFCNLISTSLSFPLEHFLATNLTG